MEHWSNFLGTKWKQVIDVNDFILNNYKEYMGSSDFLSGVSRKTSRVWSRCQKILEKEDITNVLDLDCHSFSGIDNFEPGYIDRKNEVIFGLQTDEPLKQFINPFISLKESINASKNNGYRLERELIDKIKMMSNSVDELVNETYTNEIKKLKDVHLLEGLPDNYGRGFIVGDYRRVPLYGTDFLIMKKRNDLERLKKDINYSVVRTREEIVKQIKALKDLTTMADGYGFDIRKPASNSKEAVQWLYFAILGSVKETNGASIPLGNNTAFIDIYIERDLENGTITEEEAQELIDQFAIKLRMIRFLRDGDFNNYFLQKSPIITETIGGEVGGKSLITKTAYRLLNTLENLGVSTIPNLSLLWSNNLPNNFKRYCTKVMMKYNVLQFINGNNLNSNDYAVTGFSGVSRIGKQIDYYGGTCNLPKVLLYAINGGRDCITGEVIIEGIKPLDNNVLNYSNVIKNFTLVLKKIIDIYCDSLNIIHFIQDKYVYENSIMSLNDTVVERYITLGICGLATVVDSLSAIKNTKVTVVRDENDLSTDFTSSRSFERFGKNEDDADKLASDIVKLFNKLVSEHHFYRNAKPKIGIESSGLYIVYGNNTGVTPDGRFKGTIFSPGVNATSTVATNGVLSYLKSVLKIPVKLCLNGVVTTLNVNGNALGAKRSEKSENLIALLDGFFGQNGSHLEINIIDKKTILDISNDSDLYDSLVLRNSGYPVRYRDLTEEQQNSLVDRTFHKGL